MKAGIWLRVSTDEQARGDSPLHHRERAKSFADFKKWDIAVEYNLSGVSGKSVINHPECQRMLNDIKEGKIQVLIFSKLARIARNLRELLEIADFFKAHNASLASLDESIDTSTNYGRLLYSVLGALAEWERDEISSRVASSVKIRAELGKSTGGIGPYGYKWHDKKLMIHDEQAVVVKRAFELFKQNKKLLSTCSLLTKEGIRARKSEFKPVTLKRMLTDKAYIGQRRCNYSKSKGNKKSWTAKPQEEWIYQEVPSIVDKDIWDEVQSILNANNQRYGRNGVPKAGRYLFSGLLNCECGQKMYVQPYKGMKIPRYICKHCKNKINEDFLIERFEEGMDRLRINPEQITISSYKDELCEKENRLKLLRRELGGIEGKIQNLFDILYENLIDKKTFSKRQQVLSERKTQIENEIPRLQGEVDFLSIAEQGRDFVISKTLFLSNVFNELTYDEKKVAATELLQEIVIQKNNVMLVFAYLPDISTFSIGSIGNTTHIDKGSWRLPA